MSKYFIPDSAFGQEAECPICACLWTDPVEIEGCEHILCSDCVKSLKECPSCGHTITKLKTPNHAILRMLMRVPGRCSACPWSGKYKEFKENHQKCLKSGEGRSVISSAKVESSDEVKEAERMQDYYLEDTPVGLSGAAPGSLQRQQAPPFSWTQNAAATSDALEFSLNGNTASVSATQSLSPDEARRWRQNIAAKAADYGLSEREFSSLRETFTDFATLSLSGTPALRWRGACRLLRYYNYPNHPDDVKNLFETSQQSSSTGSVSFHALCLWLSLNQRNPQQWYGMNDQDYTELLQVAQVLDVEKRGLFTLEQASLLAEQYFQRDVAAHEWDKIAGTLREKDITIREYFQNAGNYSTVNHDFRSRQGDVKLPFHDILVTFRAHVEALKKTQGEEQARSRGEQFSQRIRRMISHYEPAAIDTIDNTIAQFRGEEGELLQTLVAMYGPEPGRS